MSSSCSNLVELERSCRVHRPRVTYPSGIGHARVVARRTHSSMTAKREFAPVDAQQTLPADEEPTGIVQPGEAAFHFVPLPIASFARHDWVSSLGSPIRWASPGRDAHPDAATTQRSTERATVLSPIRHELLRSALWTTSRAGHPNRVERLFRQLHLDHLGAVEVKAQGQPYSRQPPASIWRPSPSLWRRLSRHHAWQGRSTGEGAIEEGHRPIELTPLVERR